ncbi:MAG: hypothetical protein HYZ50_10885 [Deltaproteobacteria bacterium]|nr:hypothetical protein [Deltaproteobacteria bacterium]
MNLSSYPTHRPASARSTRLSPSFGNVRAANSVLVPAFILPEQFYNRPSQSAASYGPSALMLAILEDALSCVQRQFASTKKRNQRLAREAESWIFDNDSSWPFSCANICSTLDIDIAYLRLQVKKLRQRHPAVATPERPRIIAMPNPAKLAA